MKKFLKTVQHFFARLGWWGTFILFVAIGTLGSAGKSLADSNEVTALILLVCGVLLGWSTYRRYMDDDRSISL